MKVRIHKGHMGLFRTKIYTKGKRIYFKIKADDPAITAKIKIFCGEYCEEEVMDIDWDAVPDIVMKLDTSIIMNSLLDLVELSDDSNIPDRVQIQDKGLLYRSLSGVLSELSVKHGRLRYKLAFQDYFGHGSCSLDLGYAIPDKIGKVTGIVENLTEALSSMSNVTLYSSTYTNMEIKSLPYRDND